MIPSSTFARKPKAFWASVRTISELVGCTDRRTRQIKVPTMTQVARGFAKLGLSTSHLMDSAEQLTGFGRSILEYFEYRATVLNEQVEPLLMCAAEAKAEFERLRDELAPTCPLPMNKQSGDKRAPAYLTCIVNMLVQANSGGRPCDYDPRQLTSVAVDGIPLRTLARRVDGAFPAPVNPVAVWEVKEYYHTTTFGSRVADGVYESLLDGMELEELRESESIDVKHYLMVDARYTWWDCGRSYLCRLVDLLHMGYADEILFGREVIRRLPALVGEWVQALDQR